MEENWDHGLVDGIDFAGGVPYSIGSDIAYQERCLGVAMDGLAVNPDQLERWREWLPSMIPIRADDAIPMGCAYMLSVEGLHVAFVIHANLAHSRYPDDR